MTVFHADAPGQPNGRFGHSDAWKGFCSLCQGLEADIFFVDDMPQDPQAVPELAAAPPADPRTSQSGPETEEEA